MGIFWVSSGYRNDNGVFNFVKYTSIAYFFFDFEIFYKRNTWKIITRVSHLQPNTITVREQYLVFADKKKKKIENTIHDFFNKFRFMMSMLVHYFYWRIKSNFNSSNECVYVNVRLGYTDDRRVSTHTISKWIFSKFAMYLLFSDSNNSLSRLQNSSNVSSISSLVGVGVFFK